MEIVEHLLVLAHLLGMAAIIGSAVFVARGAVTPALVWGARAQLGDGDVNHAKVGVKLLVAIAVAACAEIAAAKTKKGDARPQLVTAAGALALLNTAIAVLW
jgi:hypothetical protein